MGIMSTDSEFWSSLVRNNRAFSFERLGIGRDCDSEPCVSSGCVSSSLVAVFVAICVCIRFCYRYPIMAMISHR